MAVTESAELQKSQRRFVRRALAAPMLSREHEVALGRRWVERRDEAALHELVSSYTRLVVGLAARFRGYGLPVGDLIQEGNVGLMEAASRFDPERGVRLSTYASWWIRASIQDYVLRNWSVVRLGTTAAEKTLFFNLRRLRARIAAASAGYLSQEQRDLVADELGVGSAAVEAMEGRLSGSDQSLNTTVGDAGDIEWQDLLEDDGPSPEAVAIALKDGATRSRWLAAALAQLPAREARIIRERHLADDVSTLETLGRRLGISKERVRQLERRALHRLQRDVARQSDPGAAAASARTP
jgi:RNA polymerase sigma-32 factor